MITFEQAMQTVTRHAKPLPAVKARIEEAAGRLLVEDVRSAVEMPPFNKSAVDGYAVRSAEVRPGCVLSCKGLIQAGDEFKGKAGRGECVKIMTGAPVPSWADAVVMVEETSEAGGLVRFGRDIRSGSNIARRGEDIKKGQLVLKRGAVIAVQQIAALAAAGRSHVRVGALPSVSIINTGGEIVAPGARRGKNAIYNSNGPMLAALLRSDGVAASPVIVRDEEKKLKSALAAALKSDIALISGGVSMGDYDLVPGVLKKLGVKKIFHTVRVRPGKPMFFGVKGRKLVFGIPGNPVANFLAYLAYIRPAIRKMEGRRDFGPAFAAGICGKAFEPRTPRRALVLSKVSLKRECFLLPVANNGSADILALAEAGGFTMIKEGGSVSKKGRALFLGW